MEQVRLVHQQLDEVQKEVLKSKGEIGESSKGSSPFTPEIQGKPLLASFRLSTLELYDDSDDSTEHIAAFRAQMALYDTSDALMCSKPNGHTPNGTTKGRIIAFTGNTATTRKNAVIYSIKSKTSSDTGTYVSMSATNPHFPLADLLEIHRPDLKVQSKSKSTLSLGDQPRAVTAPRRARLMRALRSERGRRMMKTSTSHSGRGARSIPALMMHW
ncbi:hypothetical protein BHM03_00028970 [Ensete ventricosum]|nr:hypothetical protein BHM03_00028970 [Ensete ventricosum]